MPKTFFSFIKVFFTNTKFITTLNCLHNCFGIFFQNRTSFFNNTLYSPTIFFKFFNFSCIRKNTLCYSTLSHNNDIGIRTFINLNFFFNFMLRNLDRFTFTNINNIKRTFRPTLIITNNLTLHHFSFMWNFYFCSRLEVIFIKFNFFFDRFSVLRDNTLLTFLFHSCKMFLSIIQTIK